MFLKTGKTIEIRGSSSFPFFRWLKREDPERETRLYFSKSYIYPLIAAPFIVLFGTNGFLVLHAILIALRTARRFISSCSPATKSNRVALPLAVAFLGVSVVPVYFVWLIPELLNFSLVLYALFFWALQGSRARPRLNAAAARSWPGRRRTTSPRSCRPGDVLQAAAPAAAVADRRACGEPAAVETRSRSCVICGARDRGACSR